MLFWCYIFFLAPFINCSDDDDDKQKDMTKFLLKQIKIQSEMDNTLHFKGESLEFIETSLAL